MTSNSPAIATANNPNIGLKPATKKFLDLAAHLKCSNIAAQLVELTLDAGRPVLLGAIATFLQSTEICQLCRTWAETDDIFADLADLAEGFWLFPEVPKELGYNDSSISVAERFRDDLAVHYLPAMLAAGRPHWVEESVARWLQAVRLWILRLALEANYGKNGVPSETHLSNLCREIRICCDDQNSNRLSKIRRLAFDFIPDTAVAFETEVRRARDTLLANEADKALLDSTFWTLLNRHLGALFLRHWLPQKVSTTLIPFRRASAEIDRVPPVPQLHAESTDLEPTTFALTDSKGKQTSVTSVKVDEKKTPALQEIEAHGVYLLNREDSQMLPWSWHRLSLTEHQELIKLITQFGTEPDLTARLAGAMAAIAVVTGLSARQVTDVTFAAQPSAGWSVNPKTCRLHRTPTRRSSGWSTTRSDLTDSQTQSWLRPLANLWSAELPTSLTEALWDAFRQAPTSSSLGKLWTAICPSLTFEDWLNTRFSDSPTLTRLTSPILASFVRQEVFIQTRDHALARLISSNPDTALPAPCAYAGFTGSVIAGSMAVLPPSIAVMAISARTSELNFAGSELDVIDRHLIKQISKLHDRLSNVAKDSTKWVEHHNLLVAYTVIAMLATTGSRPVHSPFESIRWFDLSNKLVFVDDKFSGPNSGSRLCLLAGPVAGMLEGAYLPHLTRLAEALRNTFPDIAQGINAALAGDTNAPLPLFFFIRNKPTFDWMEVSESGLTAACGSDDWPLPLNFFRHRMATGLRRRGLDPEIIDALLGHSEAGAETHGQHSLRVMVDDLNVARPLVELMTAELGFKVLHPSNRPLLIEVTPDRVRAPQTRRFGSKARAQMRRKTYDEARAKAARDIKQAIGDRVPASLDSKEWDKIGLAMILRPDGLPHAQGSLRYDIFQAHLRNLWDQHGVRPKVKRRFVIGRSGEPVITEAAIQAPRQLAKLVDAFEEIVKDSRRQASAPQFASALAAIEACLHCGIADPKVLLSIVRHENVKAVYFGGRSYIEHFVGDTWEDTMPRRRFEVSSRCLQWLLSGLSEQKRIKKIPAIPEKFLPLSELVGVDRRSHTGLLLNRLAHIIAQFNVVHRSGVEAAALDGRVHISALPHHAWLRAMNGQAPKIVQTEPCIDGDIDSKLDKLVIKRALVPGRDQPPEYCCRKLFQSIRAAMVAQGSTSRRQTAIRDLLIGSPFEVGDLPFVLGQWASHLLTRPAHTKSGRLREDSAVLYFNTLAPRVAAIGSSANICDLEDDELLDLYASLLNTKADPEEVPKDTVSSNENSVAKTSGASLRGAETTENDEDNDRNQNAAAPRAFAQLLDFHEWAQPLYGLEDPDWSELDELSTRPFGRPGLIRKLEYLWALETLVGPGATRTCTDESVQDSFFLILGYRFGLRGREAYGLFRADWVDAAETVVVLVRPNPLRRLKNLQSKRQVPKLEQLTQLEQSIIAETLRRWEEREGIDRDTPLMGELTTTNFKSRRLSAAFRARQLLKRATRNPSTTMHHLRHSFAGHAFSLVGGGDYAMGTEGSFGAEEIDSARRLLLGHSNVDRRGLWAICRLLGHSSPSTLLKSYFHGQLAHPSIDINPGSSGRPHGLHLIDLDCLEIDEEYLTPVLSFAQPVNDVANSSSSLEGRVNFLRLRLLGYSEARAAHTVGLGIEGALYLEAYIGEAVQRLERSHPTDAPFNNAVDLARRVDRSRWKKLRELASAGGVGRTNLVDGNEVITTEVIGRSRQIVLFRLEHVQQICSFIRQLKLTPSDLRFLRPRGHGKYLQDHLESLGLANYIDPHSRDDGTLRQLNMVTSTLSVEGGGRVTFIDRMVVIIEPDGIFGSAFELLLIWLCWAVTV